jgi:hypothetical protein
MWLGPEEAAQDLLHGHAGERKQGSLVQLTLHQSVQVWAT